MLECSEQVSEKESGVRQVMSTMGLLTSPFWLTWALFEGQLSFPLYSHLLLFALVCMLGGTFCYLWAAAPNLKRE